MRAALLVVLVLAAGCLADEPAPPGTTPTVTPTVSPTTPVGNASEASGLAQANTRFALEAFRALSAAAPGENLVVSPYSISTALQMVYGGADGATRAAMADALRLGDAEPTLDAQAGALLSNLTRSDPNVTLRIGNSLWIYDEFAPAVKPGFPERIRSAYDGEVFQRDFADARTVDDINAWASNKTKGKIPQVLDDIREDEVMFLLNAVYFNGAWSHSFNESCTHDAGFRTDDGRTVTVDMMCGGERHTYAQDDARTLVRLPYGEGRFAMYLVLPPNGTKLEDFAAAWDGDLNGSYSPYVELEMPRLEMRTKSLDLKPMLDALGMGVAFTDQADFTRIAESLFLSRVLHDAVLEVDEVGTRAAAVTTVGVGVTSMPPPPLHLVVDRPFLVVLRDDASGSLLFMAKVHDPTSG